MDAEAQAADRTEVRRLSPATRGLLVGFVLLTVLATNQLYVLSAHTDAYFAWTIKPPLTAAFLGAGFAAGLVLVLLGLRAHAWVEARIAVVTVAVFSVLTLLATVLHRNKFHFGADDPSISPEAVEAHREKQPGAEVYVYPGAGHAFNRDIDGAHYHAEAAQLAHQRTMRLFSDTLG